jgi:hypothetical protein
MDGPCGQISRLVERYFARNSMVFYENLVVLT